MVSVAKRHHYKLAKYHQHYQIRKDTLNNPIITGLYPPFSRLINLPKKILRAPQVVWISYETFDNFSDNYDQSYVPPPPVSVWETGSNPYQSGDPGATSFWKNFIGYDGAGTPYYNTGSDLATLFSNDTFGNYHYRYSLDEDVIYATSPNGFDYPVSRSWHERNFTVDISQYSVRQQFANPQKPAYDNFWDNVFPEVVEQMQSDKRHIINAHVGTDEENYNTDIFGNMPTPNEDDYVGSDFLFIKIGPTSATPDVDGYLDQRNKVKQAYQKFPNYRVMLFSNDFDIPIFNVNALYFPMTVAYPSGYPGSVRVGDPFHPPINTTVTPLIRIANSHTTPPETLFTQWRADIDRFNANINTDMDVLRDRYSELSGNLSNLASDLSAYNYTFEGDGTDISSGDIISIIKGWFGS